MGSHIGLLIYGIGEEWGGVVKAKTVKDFEWRLDTILADQEIVYNFKENVKFTHLKNVIFDDAIQEEEDIEDAAS